MISLYNGDCLEVMKDLSGASIDLILCDLPYGCLHPERKRDTTKWYDSPRQGCAWDIALDLEAFWEQVKRVRKQDNTPTLHFCTTRFGYDLIESNKKEFRYDLVWDKQRGVSFLSANKMPMRSHEMVYVFSKTGAYYNRMDISGNFKEHKQYGIAKSDSTYGVVNRKKPITRPIGTITSTADKRCVLSVIHNPTSPTKGGHPTEKPIELYKFLIERYCPPGGTVLDPTFGSGNSAAAAQSLGRNYIGIEKDKGFYDKAVKRLGAE